MNVDVDEEIDGIVSGKSGVTVAPPIRYDIGQIEKDVNKIKKENRELKRRLDFCYEQIETIAKIISSE